MHARQRNKPSNNQKVEQDGKQTQNNNSNNNKKHGASNNGFNVYSFIKSLWDEEDASYLAFFRIFWGLIMFYEVWSFVQHDFVKTRMVWFTPQQDEFLLQYVYFEWLGRLSLFWMKGFLLVMMLLAIFVTIGLFYRVSATLFFLGFSYIFLLEQSIYLNHFYLVCIMAGVIVFLPANAQLSVDNYIWPSTHKPTVPKLVLWTLRAFMLIVYCYAGVAKINADWLRAEPLRHWLPKRHYLPILGNFLRRESAAYFMSYGGLVYDLVVGFLLWYRPTLPIGLAATAFFHISNKIIFNIGIFPWMMMASTTLFFSPDWPRWLSFSITKALKGPKTKAKLHYHAVTSGRVPTQSLTAFQWCVTIMAFSFLLLNIWLPLRHHMYQGDVAWNELGHKYSWRMKLRDKQCDLMVYVVRQQRLVTFRHTQLDMNPRQVKKVESRPDLLALYVRHLADKLEREEGERPEIYVLNQCQLNFRGYQPMVNITRNLANVDPWATYHDWVVPLRPMPEKFYDEYPWNWSWNFNWLLGGDIDNLPRLVREYEEMKSDDRFRSEAQRGVREVAEYIVDKYHNGQRSEVDVLAESEASKYMRDLFAARKQKQKQRN